MVSTPSRGHGPCPDLPVRDDLAIRRNQKVILIEVGEAAWTIEGGELVCRQGEGILRDVVSPERLLKPPTNPIVLRIALLKGKAPRAKSPVLQKTFMTAPRVARLIRYCKIKR